MGHDLGKIKSNSIPRLAAFDLPTRQKQVAIASLKQMAHVGFEVKGIIKALNHSVVTRLRLWVHSNRAIY